MYKYGYGYIDNNENEEEAIDQFYRGHRDGYTYAGYGHYDNNNGCSGFYEYKDEDGNIVRHYDM